jgi:hypothetical protein
VQKGSVYLSGKTPFTIFTVAMVLAVYKNAKEGTQRVVTAMSPRYV